MISNEIRNRIEAKCDIQESKNNSKNKERKEFQNQKERNSNFSESVRAHEHLNNIRKCSIPWTCESRVVRSDLMSVYV